MAVVSWIDRISNSSGHFLAFESRGPAVYKLFRLSCTWGRGHGDADMRANVQKQVRDAL